MRRVVSGLALIVISLVLVTPVAAAADGSLGWWGRWQTAREARQAIAAGDAEAALAAYGRLLDGSQPGDSLRSEALYRSALLTLSTDDGGAGEQAARDLLARLDGERGADRWRLERRSLDALLERHQAAREAAQRAEQERQAAVAELERRRDQIARVDDTEARLAELEAEVARRDAALRMLREQIVEAQPGERLGEEGEGGEEQP